MLRAGADALASLYPSALGCAFASFADGSEGGAIAALACYGARADKHALTRALPSAVGAHAASSVARSLATGRAVDSRSLEAGVGACSDWAAARDGGMRTLAAITVPLTAGRVTLGFAQAHFSAMVERDEWEVRVTALRDLADAVGSAVFVRRALAVARDSHLSLGGMRTRPAGGPPRGGAPPPGGGPAPEARLSPEDAARLAALDDSALEDRAVLGTWALDAWALGDAELARLTAAMLHALNLFRTLRISPTRFDAFVAEAASHYADNPFHCWRHGARAADGAGWRGDGARGCRGLSTRLPPPPQRSR